MKLGDFGISRELESKDAKTGTSCGTPLFMPPELCLGQKYDHKADVWAVGIIIYELITLKKPFESETVTGVLQQIIKAEYEPLPEETHPNLKLLVSRLLKKDHTKRPTIFDIAKIPCMKKELLAYIEEHKCYDEVIEIIDLINVQVLEPIIEQNENVCDVEKKAEQKLEDSEEISESLEEWTEYMHSDIETIDYSNAWLGGYKRYCYGGQIFQWLTCVVSQEPKKADFYCQKMMDLRLIRSIKDSKSFDLHDMY